MHVLFLVRKRRTPHTAIQQAAAYDAEFLRSEGHEATVLAIDPRSGPPVQVQIEVGPRKHRGKTVLSGGYIPPTKLVTLHIERMANVEPGFHIVETEPRRVLRIEKVIDGPVMKLICREVKG